jgi:predicted Zn-dependent protease
MTSVTLVGLLALGLVAAPVAQSGDPAARQRAAAQAMSEGRFDEAASIYRDLLAIRADDPGLLTNLGRALVMGNHPAEAIAPLERVVAVRPTDVEPRRMLADVYTATGRRTEAVTVLRKVTELAPKLPGVWYALGQAYNDVKQDALRTFGDHAEDTAWRQLLAADGLAANGQAIDAFVLYRDTLERLPSMISIHDSIARIYERTEHTAWAARERARGTLPAAACAKRTALCEFRAGRYRSALAATLTGTDPESRYWRARAANELALAAFNHLDTLADSPERHVVRATVARTQERFNDAIVELTAALKFAPGDPALLFELASSYYSARDYEQALATLAPLLEARPDDPRLLRTAGNALLQLRRPEEARPRLQRAVERDPSDAAARLALGRACFQTGDFAAAIPLIEAQINDDRDGSLHVQLARAYAGLGQKEKATALFTRSQELQRADQERNAAAAQRAITPPK